MTCPAGLSVKFLRILHCIMGREGHLCILEEITVTRRGRAMSNATLVNCWEERGREGRRILILLHVHMLPLQTSQVTVTALEAYSIILLKGSQS